MSRPSREREEDRGGRLGRVLLDAGLVSRAQLQQALAAQRETGRMLGRTLVDLGYIDEDTLVGALARQLRLPVADLRGLRIDPQLLELVPPKLAYKLRCLPLYLESSGTARFLHIAIEDPGDEYGLEELRGRVGVALRPVLAAPSAMDAALFRNYGANPRRGAGSESEEASGRAEKPRVEPEILVKALVQLLVEKGVIDRQELAERLESLARRN